MPCCTPSPTQPTHSLHRWFAKRCQPSTFATGSRGERPVLAIAGSGRGDALAPAARRSPRRATTDGCRSSGRQATWHRRSSRRYVRERACASTYSARRRRHDEPFVRERHAVRREVLGDAHVDRAAGGLPTSPQDFQDFITPYAWGGIWTRPGLDRRSRSMITLTALVRRRSSRRAGDARTRGAPQRPRPGTRSRRFSFRLPSTAGFPPPTTAFQIAQRVRTEEGDRRVTSAFLYAARRTPFGKFGGARSPACARRPGGSRVTDRRRRPPGSTRARSTRSSGQRQRRGRGQPQRGADGRAASGPADVGPRHDGEPAVRIQSRRRHDRGSRQIETGDAEVVLAGGVESMTRAPWVLPKPAGVPGRECRAVSTDSRLAAGQPAMPAAWTVSLGEANEQLADERRHRPRAAGRSSRCGPTSSRAAWDGGVLRRPGRPGPWCRPEPDEGIRDRTATRGRSAATSKPLLPTRRHNHRRQRLAPQRRRMRAPRWLGGGGRGDRPGPLARIAGRGFRPRAATLRVRPRRGRRTRAETGRHLAGPTSGRSSSTRLSRRITGLHRRLGHRPGHR